MPAPELLVEEIIYYPVKSCAGTSLETAEFDDRGIIHDRGWVIVNEKGVAITQREAKELALVKPEVETNGKVQLKLSAPGMSSIVIPEVDQASDSNDEITCQIWKDSVCGVDQGAPASKWLSDYMGRPARLIRMAKETKRIVAKTEDKVVGFADGYPVLIISSASLEELNRSLEKPIKMNRFRPNIVISGCEPYAEDAWRQIKIGDLLLDVVKPCARCVVTTIEQETATKEREPLKTLSRTRLKDNQVLFGQNAIHLNSSKISVGDQLKVLH